MQEWVEQDEGSVQRWKRSEGIIQQPAVDVPPEETVPSHLYERGSWAELAQCAHTHTHIKPPLSKPRAAEKNNFTG